MNIASPNFVYPIPLPVPPLLPSSSFHILPQTLRQTHATEPESTAQAKGSLEYRLRLLEEGQESILKQQTEIKNLLSQVLNQSSTQQPLPQSLAINSPSQAASNSSLAVATTNKFGSISSILNPPQRVESLIERAKIHYEKGELGEALKLLNTVLVSDPKQIEALLGRGSVFFLKGQLDAAFKDFSEILILNPKHIEALTERGRVYYLKGEVYASLKDFNEALALNPTWIMALIGRATAYKSLRKFEEALKDLDVLLTLNSQNAPALIEKGHILYLKHDLKGSLENVNAALNIAPNDTRAIAFKTILLQHENKMTVPFLDQALQINPGYLHYLLRI